MVKKFVLLLFLSSCVVFFKPAKVEYKMFSKYEVRIQKQIPDSALTRFLIVKSQTDFEKYFYPVTGKKMEDDIPMINFKEEFVVAIVLPKSEMNNSIKVSSFIYQKNKYIINYEVSSADENSGDTTFYFICRVPINKQLTEIVFQSETSKTTLNY